MTSRTSPSFYSIALPLILWMAGTAILYSYISPWAPINSDSLTYLRLAGEIQKGQWHIDQWARGVVSIASPLYPALVALVEWIIPGFDTAGTLVSILAASIAVIPLFFIARHFYGEKVAWVVIPLTILNPWYLRYGPLVLTESLFNLFFLLGIILTLYALTHQNSPILWFMSGIMGGAAWTTRDVGIIIPSLSFLWFAITMWKNKCLFPKIIRNGIALVLGIMLIYVPFKIVLIIDHKGIPDIPTNSITFQLMMPDLRDLTEREVYFGRLNADNTEYVFVETQENPQDLVYVLRHWDWIVERLGKNLAGIEKSIMKELGLLLLALISLGIFKWNDPYRKESKRFPGVLPFLGSYVLSYLLFYIFAGGFTGAIGPERYLVPLVPIWGIWASVGIFEIMQRYKMKHQGRYVTILCIGIVLVVYFPHIKQVAQIYQQEKEDTKLQVRLGMKVHEISRSYGMKDMVIMSRKPFLPYYAKSSWIMLPYGEYQDIIKFARTRDVDFLYINKQTVPLRPQLSFLMSSHVSLPEIERIYSLRDKDNPENLTAVVYRVKK